MSRTLAELEAEVDRKAAEIEQLQVRRGQADAPSDLFEQIKARYGEFQQVKKEADEAREIDGIKSAASQYRADRATPQRRFEHTPQSPNGDGNGHAGDGGSVLGDVEKGRAVKSLGYQFLETEAYQQSLAALRSGTKHQSVASLEGALKATLLSTGLTNYDRQAGIVMVGQQRLTVADLLAPGTTTSPVIRYVRENSFTNAATAVAEGAAKPEATWDLVEADAPVRKIAVTAKVTDEMFADFPAIRSYIDERMRFMIAQTEESQLLNGNGTPPNIRGILATVGIQTQPVGVLSATNTVADNILKAITKIRTVGFFEPDGIVIHPTDWQNLRLAKDANGQYFAGGPFTGAYGVGPFQMEPPLWGLKVVVTTAIAAGTALVGAFRLGAQVFRREGVTLESTNSNEDDFKKNLICIRAEERLALAVYRPLAFCTVTGVVLQEEPTGESRRRAA